MIKSVFPSFLASGGIFKPVFFTFIEVNVLDWLLKGTKNRKLIENDSQTISRDRKTIQFEIFGQTLIFKFNIMQKFGLFEEDH